MKNKMREYLGNEYSDNHIRNFCLYWIKASGGYGDYWRKANDLDCLYFDGNLRADTLMSAWTPIKWILNCLNIKKKINFYKIRKDCDDPNQDLKILVEESEIYLPKDHRLVKLLDLFLELAEQRCNFILLPDRKMNCSRYKIYINGKEVWLYDEVPAMLSHIFDKDSLGRYFLSPDKDLDIAQITTWINREHLEMGFKNNTVKLENVHPLVKGLNPYEAKWLKDEIEIEQALKYMIDFLEKRKMALQDKDEF